ncbi:DNA-protecting protein DprA [Pseudodesulfovibrio cashew]|uniref:DNA-protecting protein DprA n=1 Tax=Pseudodesulfovibrio cashew TaxID=2678688 RepID=A0A6I6JM92_9BACT|nr:DNA-processing protein DprA [Pseudodesulfovibrio cashew]QGY41412.1 DNA-protecting protein DprA [Pseudodesulfovibrio cashew]
MDLDKEFFACLALKHTPRLGPRVWKQLFSHFDSAYDALSRTEAWIPLGVESHFIKSIVAKCRSEAWRDKAEEEFRLARRAGMDVVTWFDPRFPDSLKTLEDPPVLLYCRGDTTLFNNPGVAVVGARECTALGLRAAGHIASQLSGIGITVISGLALGIDRQAHLGGLSGVGGSIAVLGCGLDIDYPGRNADVRRKLEEQGLVVTEYGPGVGPRSGHFPVRNRLISGLSLGVLVAEAAHNSGSLITARLAGEQGRDVFALPGPLGQPTFTGCHRLIKQGAALVETAEDIVEILRYDFARELDDIPDPEPFEEGTTSELEGTPRGTTNFMTAPVEGTSSSGREPTERIGRANGAAKGDGLLPASRKRPSAVERESMNLSGDESRVMEVLVAEDKVHVDSLGRRLEWPPAKISKILIMLEMRGAVQQLPGMWYLAREE